MDTRVSRLHDIEAITKSVGSRDGDVTHSRNYAIGPVASQAGFGSSIFPAMLIEVGRDAH